MTDDLVAIAYPGANRAGKKHRVAVLRASDKVGRRIWWAGGRENRSGGQLVWYNLCDLRSYALGRLRMSEWQLHHPTVESLLPLIEDPAVHHSRWSWLQPGGAWHVHVEINCLRRDGRHDEAENMADAFDASLVLKKPRCFKPPKITDHGSHRIISQRAGNARV